MRTIFLVIWCIFGHWHSVNKIIVFPSNSNTNSSSIMMGSAVYFNRGNLSASFIDTQRSQMPSTIGYRKNKLVEIRTAKFPSVRMCTLRYGGAFKHHLAKIRCHYIYFDAVSVNVTLYLMLVRNKRECESQDEGREKKIAHDIACGVYIRFPSLRHSHFFLSSVSHTPDFGFPSSAFVYFCNKNIRAKVTQTQANQ